MELDEPAKYALGALFVVALHANELRAGSEANQDQQVAWGEHSDRVVVVDTEASEEEQQEAAARWDAFWGRDLVFPGGLLDRVFTKLSIHNTSWPGLKVLPEVAGEAGYAQIVQQYRGGLHADFRGLPAPAVETQPPLNALEQPKAAEGQLAADLEGQVEAEDEDLAGDLRRGKYQSGSQKPKPKSKPEPEPSKTTEAWNADFEDLTVEDKEAPTRGSGGASSKGATQPSIPKPQDGMPASELARSAQGAAGDPTPLAFLAVTQLLEACVASLDMPKLQDIVEADPNSKKGIKREVAPETPGSEKGVNVRWYDARAREAIERVADWLQVPWAKVLLYECMLAQQSQAPEAKGDGKKQLSAGERQMRALKIGAAAAGGGAILALTGGLAAPALAAVAGTALSTVGAAGTAAAITGAVGSSMGAAAIIAGFGAGGAHVVGGKMARRIGDVKEFGFQEIPDDENFSSYFSVDIPTTDGQDGNPQGGSNPMDRPPEQKGQESGQQGSSWFSGVGSSVSSWTPWSKKPGTDAGPLLPIPVSTKPRADPKLVRTIAVAGWIAAPSDFVDQWRGLSTSGAERFSLVWESKELIALTRSMMEMILNQALSRAGQYLIENFVIHGLVGAVALPMTILNVSGLIDSSWAIVMNRAARAGELLAHLLMSGAHGDCPVTLVGHSMGARLIFHCLLELCRCQCKGIVQHAVMLGTPVDVIPERWVMARSVVSGRCVNAYSKNDWVLALSFRARQGTFRPAAGLGSVPVPGVENVDVSDLVNGHGDYVKNMDVVLRRLGLAQE